MDLIRPHQRTVYAAVFSLLENKEDAEDVAQDTLVKAMARLHQLRKDIDIRYLVDPDSDQ
jgi:DNA-directed RNA polymerase specialized sigma24 family protein